jgi:hypothetical protein
MLLIITSNLSPLTLDPSQFSAASHRKPAPISVLFGGLFKR